MFLVLQHDKRGFTIATYHFFGDYSELCRLYGDLAYKTIVEAIKALGPDSYVEGDKLEIIEQIEINQVFYKYEHLTASLIRLFRHYSIGI
jgi:hypothetical protein